MRMLRHFKCIRVCSSHLANHFDFWPQYRRSQGQQTDRYRDQVKTWLFVWDQACSLIPMTMGIHKTNHLRKVFPVMENSVSVYWLLSVGIIYDGVWISETELCPIIRNLCHHFSTESEDKFIITQEDISMFIEPQAVAYGTIWRDIIISTFIIGLCLWSIYHIIILNQTNSTDWKYAATCLEEDYQQNIAYS